MPATEKPATAKDLDTDLDTFLVALVTGYSVEWPEGCTLQHFLDHCTRPWWVWMGNRLEEKMQKLLDAHEGTFVAFEYTGQRAMRLRVRDR